MRQSIAILSVLASAAFAKSNTVEFFFPGGYNGVAPVASVVTANPSTTVLDLACPTGADSTDCGFRSGMRFSIISTTIYQAHLTEPGFDMTFSCDNNVKAAQMTCAVSVAGSDDGPMETTSVLSGTDVAFMTVSVTAGAKLLGAARKGAVETGAGVIETGVGNDPDPTTSSSASSATVSPSTGLVTTPSATTTLVTGASGAQPATTPTTNAAFRYGIEGSALLALAGAAAINMW